jgi:hypothetical protein
MPFQVIRGPIAVLVGATLACLSTGCSDFKMPRMSEDRSQRPQIPASVNLVFDEALQDSKLTFDQPVCSNTIWEGKLGETIIDTFTKAAKSRIAQVTVGVRAQSATPAAGSPQAVAAGLAIEGASFTSRTRTGSEDVFLGHLEIHLRATAFDATSQQTAVAPLVFSDDVKLWVPQFGGTACSTAQFDERMRNAVDFLADQWLNFISAALTRSAPPPSQEVKTAPASPLSTAPSVISAPAPATQALPLPRDGKDPHRFAVIVGLSLYRSPWPDWKEGLTFDSREALSTFAERFDVPKAQTLVLQDELAAQSDIEEALAQWLPKRVTQESLVLFYFAGRTAANPKDGEVYLIPYDATPASSQSRLISLRFLQSRLQKLGARLAVAMIDGPLVLAAPPPDRKSKAIPPNWIADLNSPTGPKGGPMIQAAQAHVQTTQQSTLLARSGSSADLDHDGTVTVGEWLRSLRGQAITAPSLPPSAAIQSIPLAHLNHR